MYEYSSARSEVPHYRGTERTLGFYVVSLPNQLPTVLYRMGPEDEGSKLHRNICIYQSTRRRIKESLNLQHSSVFLAHKHFLSVNGLNFEVYFMFIDAGLI